MHQLLLKHTGKSKLHTLTVLLVILSIPVFLFLLARYLYPAYNSTAYIALAFGIFVSGGTILIMRKPFVDGLRFSPNYVLDDSGVTLVSGKTINWNSFEKAVVFFVEKEKYIGFKFKNNCRDYNVDELAPCISSRMISRAAGLPFTFQIDTFTATADTILSFVNKKVPVETATQVVKLDENSFEDIYGQNTFK